jgi:hypothetical protein
MRGEIDDVLARMARREALQRRREAEEAARRADPVAQVTEAVREVVDRHPSLAVTMWVTDGSALTALHVLHEDGRVTIRPAAEPAMPSAGAPPESWPMTVRTPGSWTPSPEPPRHRW